MKKAKKYHLLSYVLNSEPKLKKFTSKLEMGRFIDKFLKDHPDYMATESGDWIDFCISDISGEVHFFTDGLEVE